MKLTIKPSPLLMTFFLQPWFCWSRSYLSRSQPLGDKWHGCCIVQVSFLSPSKQYQTWNTYLRYISLLLFTCVCPCRGPMVDAYGFERPADFDYKSYDEFMSHYVPVLARRAGRWATLLDGTEHLTVTQKCNSCLLYNVTYLSHFCCCVYYCVYCVKN